MKKAALRSLCQRRMEASDGAVSDLFRGISFRFLEDFVCVNQIPDGLSTADVFERFVRPACRIR